MIAEQTDGPTVMNFLFLCNTHLLHIERCTAGELGDSAREFAYFV